MPPSYPHQANADNDNITPQTSEGSDLPALTVSVTPMGEASDSPTKSGEAAAIAEAIKKAGMAGPASIALRIAGPLSWLGGQMLWAVQPLLQGLHVGPGSSQRKDKGLEGLVPRLATFLEGEGNVAELITHLEAKPGVQSPKSKVEGPKPVATLSNTHSAIFSRITHHASRRATSHPPKGGEDGPV